MSRLTGQFSEPATGASGSWKKPIAIGLIIVGALAVLGIIAFVFWFKAAPPSSVPVESSPEITNAPVTAVPQPVTLSPVKVPPPPGAPGPFVPTMIKPGLNRALTTAEKKSLGFIVTDDIWLMTTKPTDGSQPQLSYYNKTVPAQPRPADEIYSPAEKH